MVKVMLNNNIYTQKKKKRKLNKHKRYYNKSHRKYNKSHRKYNKSHKKSKILYGGAGGDTEWQAIKYRVAAICRAVNQRNKALSGDNFQFLKSLRGKPNIPADMVPRIQRAIDRETERRGGGGGEGGDEGPENPRDRLIRILKVVNQRHEALSDEDFQFLESLRGNPDIQDDMKRRIVRAIKRETERRDRLIRILKDVNQQGQALSDDDFQFLQSLMGNADAAGIKDEMRRRIERAINIETARRELTSHELKYILIPGANNGWGKYRLTQAECSEKGLTYNPAHWQGRLEEMIGDDNILKSTPEYNGTSEYLYCGHNKNIPFRVKNKLISGSQDIHMTNCVQNIFETNIEISKSVISTSQGSAILFDYIARNPDMLNNVRSIVFVSPATVYPHGPQGDAALKALEDFLDSCKNREIGILLLLNEYEYGSWIPSAENCQGSACAKIIGKLNSDHGDLAVKVPGTTHSFDLKVGLLKYALDINLLRLIKQWCENPTEDAALFISAMCGDPLSVN